MYIRASSNRNAKNGEWIGKYQVTLQRSIAFAVCFFDCSLRLTISTFHCLMNYQFCEKCPEGNSIRAVASRLFSKRKTFFCEKEINYVHSIRETFVNAQIAMIDMTSIISVAINSKCSYFVIQQKIVGLIAQTTTPFPNSVKSNRFPNRFFQTKTQYHAKDKTVELTTKKE